MREESVIYDDYTGAARKHIWGFIYNRLTLPGLSICYVLAFTHPYKKPSEIDLEEAQDTWQIEHAEFEVVAADDTILSANQIGEIIINNKCEIIEMDWSLIGEDEILAIDNIIADSDPAFISHTVRRDNDSDLQFRGTLLGIADSSSVYGNSRWEELAVYKTLGGRYVCKRVGRTEWAGETDRCTGAVCDTFDEVVAFFGFKKVAKELYVSAGINTAVVVD